MKQTTLLTLLALTCLASAYPNPPHALVNSTNNAIAPGLMHFTNNIGGVPANTPSFENPIAFFDLQLLAAMPTADEMISSQHPPEVLWAWGESHSNGPFVKTTPGPEDCADTVTTRTGEGPPVPVDFHAGVKVNTTQRSVHLYASSFQNPFQTPFTAAELDLPPFRNNETNTTVFPQLEVNISATVSFPYKDEKDYDTRECQVTCGDGGCSVSCWCEHHHDTTEFNITLSRTADKSFQIEPGLVEQALVTPMTGQQLALSQEFVFVGFSNKRLYKHYFLANDSLAAADYAAFFNTTQDAYGALHVYSALENSTGLKQDDDQAPQAGVPASSQWLFEDAWITPTPFSTGNSSYEYQHAARMFLSALPGRISVQNTFYDYFGDNYSISANASIQQITRLGLSAKTEAANTTRAEITLSAEDGTPAASQTITLSFDGQSQPVATDAGGKASATHAFTTPGTHYITAYYAGSDSLAPATTRTSLTTYSTTPPIDFTSFGPLTILLAAFTGALFATGRLPFTGSAGVAAGAATATTVRMLTPKPRTRAAKIGTSAGKGENAGDAASAPSAAGGAGKSDKPAGDAAGTDTAKATEGKWGQFKEKFNAEYISQNYDKLAQKKWDSKWTMLTTILPRKKSDIDKLAEMRDEADQKLREQHPELAGKEKPRVKIWADKIIDDDKTKGPTVPGFYDGGTVHVRHSILKSKDVLANTLAHEMLHYYQHKNLYNYLGDKPDYSAFNFTDGLIDWMKTKDWEKIGPQNARLLPSDYLAGERLAGLLATSLEAEEELHKIYFKGDFAGLQQKFEEKYGAKAYEKLFKQTTAEDAYEYLKGLKPKKVV